MSDLMKFMMMVIALVFLAFLNSRTAETTYRERKRKLAMAAHRKLPV